MTTGEQPLTRRQARELERSREDAEAATPLSRRATAPEPTPGGETPVVVTPNDFDSLLAAAEPAASAYQATSAYGAEGSGSPTTTAQAVVVEAPMRPRATVPPTPP